MTKVIFTWFINKNPVNRSVNWTQVAKSLFVGCAYEKI
jgi:hypothetical protein